MSDASDAEQQTKTTDAWAGADLRAFDVWNGIAVAILTVKPRQA